MKKRVLILGGGFAGIESAIFLDKSIFDVTLVSDRNYFFIYPISIWIPTGEISFKDVTLPLDALGKKHGFEVVQDKVSRIEAKNSKVYLSDEVVSYDYLIVALGQGKMQLPGLEYSLSTCGLPEESIKMQASFDELIKKGKGTIAFGFGGNPKDTSAVRGGPAFELIFNFIHKLKKLNLYDQFEIIFYAPMKEPGKRMGGNGVKMLDKFFDKVGVKKKIGVPIKSFSKGLITFKDDSSIQCDLNIFIPGGSGHPVLTASDIPLTEAGYIKADEYNRVDGFQNVYAVGDVAALLGPAWAAKQGHIAEIMSRNAATNLKAIETGRGKLRSYIKHLNILCVMDMGNGAAFTYRKGDKDFIIPLPIVGHWIKIAWGKYFKKTKMKSIPRIPGM